MIAIIMLPIVILSIVANVVAWRAVARARSRASKERPIELAIKFEQSARGPWAYFANEITPRKFEAWKP